MSVDSARSSLKVFGILCIILGVFGIILGVAMFAGGQIMGFQLVANPATQGEAAELAGLVLVLAICMIIAAIVDLLLGIFSIIGANNPSKIMPAFVLSLISLILSVASLVMNLINGDINVSTIISGALSILFGALIFWCTNTIRKDGYA